MFRLQLGHDHSVQLPARHFQTLWLYKHVFLFCMQIIFLFFRDETLQHIFVNVYRHTTAHVLELITLALKTEHHPAK